MKKKKWLLQTATGLFAVMVVALCLQKIVQTLGDNAYQDAGVSLDENGLAVLQIDLNTADKNELFRLPGMTATVAQAILNYREYYGAFTDVREVGNVSGVSLEMRDQWVPYLILGDGESSATSD